jgi:hypothetical protein
LPFEELFDDLAVLEKKTKIKFILETTELVSTTFPEEKCIDDLEHLNNCILMV